MARAMVCQLGMSDKLGMINYAGENEYYLGREMGRRTEYSEHTAEEIDAEVKRILGKVSLRDIAVWDDCVKGIDTGNGFKYAVTGRFHECAVFENDPEEEARMRDYVQRNFEQCDPKPGEESCNKQYHYSNVAIQRGRYVADLKQEDFVLLEDGRPQAVRYFSRQTDLPLTIGLMIDTSTAFLRRVIAVTSKKALNSLRFM